MSDEGERPDYGIDAPAIVTAVFWTAAVFAALALASATLGGSLVAYAKRGKFNVCDDMLDMFEWDGDETVLDIGTGRGLVAIAAAKRVPAGRVVGVDIWNAEDLSGNSRAGALHNARLEGVADRVEMRAGDVRALPFDDATFDVVFSLSCLHTIDTQREREEACAQVLRVLKPRGHALIADYSGVEECAETFEALGAEVNGPAADGRRAYTYMKMIAVTKP